MAWKRTLIILAATCMSAATAHAAFYPLWLEPLKTEDAGVQAAAGGMDGRRGTAESLRRLRFCIENYPDSPYRPWYALQLADGLYELNEPDAAISWYQLLESLPEDTKFADVPGFSDLDAARTEAWLGLARSYTVKGDTRRAVVAMSRVLPRNDADRVLMAELQLLHNRRQSAIDLAGATAGVQIADPALRLRLGLLYRNLRYYNQAEAIFKSLADCDDPVVKSQAAQMYKLSQLPTPSNLIDGEYDGSSAADGGLLELKVKISGGSVSGVKFNSFPLKAAGAVYEALPRRLAARGQAFCDPVHGADRQSTAVFVAVADAVGKARRN
ncbi:MAG: hypothetical protein PHI85_05325 [Victivallaceae bacterium]|nr:hypothetical protein [Victivallaceae bacterium]